MIHKDRFFANFWKNSIIDRENRVKKSISRLNRLIIDINKKLWKFETDTIKIFNILGNGEA